MVVSRRNFLGIAGAGLLLGHSRSSKAQQAPAMSPLEPVVPFPYRSKVALIQGQDRRKNVHDALVAIDDQVRPKLRRKKYVLIKPNGSFSPNLLAGTHADALRGILDYLAPRFNGPVVIAESTSGDTLEVYEGYHYNGLPAEYGKAKLSLVDLNREAKYKVIPIIDFDLHVTPVRLAARVFDPAAFVICSAVMKTHNTVIATLSVKNMVLGAPLRNAPGVTPLWSDKRKFHVGVRQTNYNMLLAAQKLQPNWGAAVIDGFEGMEGNGPRLGTAVPSRIAIASTDYIAADRVALETMGINPGWVGYLSYCGQLGLGQYDLAKIDILGAPIASVKRNYQMSPDMQRELQWMGPMESLPPVLGLPPLHAELWQDFDGALG
jgi:uncharacterized protein (DUF362 family)